MGIQEDQFSEKQLSPSLTVYQLCEPMQVKAFAIVIHGLNLKPEKMEPIIIKLVESDIQVFNISLFGHGDNFAPMTDLTETTARMESFKEVTYERWEEETYAIYKKVKLEANQRKIPVFLVGYSLGGLVGVNLLASKPDVQFKKMVLFAPALRIHMRSHFVKVLSPFPRLIIPSMSPISYRANSGTSVAAYLALFEGIESLERHLSKKLNIPTLVFLDRNDELVSYERMSKLLNDNDFYRWRIQEIQNENPIYHHLIIDEVSLGKESWNQINDSMIKHLFKN
ncbi:lysophospholipase [bacterium]|nr:lysophospholipase [bacterium]